MGSRTTIRPELTPGGWLRELLTQLGSGHIGTVYQCPAHDDESPSLSVRDLEDGWAGIKCFHGCTTDEILRALRLTRRSLAKPMMTPPAEFARHADLDLRFPPVSHPRHPRHDPAWRYECAHDYGDRWRLVRWRHPSGRKNLAWETRDDRGAWIPGLRGTTTADLPLYRHVEVRMAVGAAESLHLVESESSADALASRGLYATTWAGGASSPPLDRLAHELTRARVVLIPDNDRPGLTCAARLERGLRPVVASLRIVLPDEGHDARDLLHSDPERLTR